jgi:SAM-dependent methyltransferase
MKPRLALLLFVLAACTSPTRERPPPAPAMPSSVQAPAPVSHPATPAPVAPVAPSGSAAPAAPPTNRDTHGNQDIEGYIRVLQSESRVSDLQIDLVVSKLALPKDAVVGDLGCGPGLFSVAFARACPDGVVYACDIEPAQLDQIREKIRADRLENIVPVLASADDPHFPPGRLDVVFIADTYHHLDDRVAYMQRLKSVLKPGGRVVLLEYKPGKLPVGPPPEHKLQPGVLEKELDEAGYVKAESFDTHPYHDFQIWRPR